jgi:hypothetical protein
MVFLKVIVRAAMSVVSIASIGAHQIDAVKLTLRLSMDSEEYKAPPPKKEQLEPPPDPEEVAKWIARDELASKTRREEEERRRLELDKRTRQLELEGAERQARQKALQESGYGSGPSQPANKRYINGVYASLAVGQ